MSKRKQPDDEAEGTLQKQGPLTQSPIDNEYEHLDDDDDEYDIDEDGVARTTKLKKDEFEEIMRAQEPSTIAQDGDIKFTPFNLTEELEEGEFDKSGNFIFKKKDDEEECEGGFDTWHESIDWDEVKRKEEETKKSHQVNEDDVAEQQKLTLIRDEYTCYKEMLRLMRADETVQKTIRRLGNDIPRRRKFNKNSKKNEQAAAMDNNTNQTQTIGETKRKLDLMIELADQRLREGDMDIYEKSYEDLEEVINR